jgi:hypothetical protein
MADEKSTRFRLLLAAIIGVLGLIAGFGLSSSMNVSKTDDHSLPDSLATSIRRCRRARMDPLLRRRMPVPINFHRSRIRRWKRCVRA